MTWRDVRTLVQQIADRSDFARREIGANAADPCDSAHGVATFCVQAGHVDPAIEICDAVLPLLRSDQLRESGRFLALRASALRSAGRPEDACQSAMSAAVRYEICGRSLDMASCLNLLGTCYAMLYQWRAADQVFRRADVIAETEGAASLTASIQINRATASGHEGDWRRSIRLARRSERPVEPDIRVMNRETQLVRAFRCLGFAERALKGAVRIRDRASALNLGRSRALAMECEADALADLGRFSEARDRLSGVLALSKTMAPDSDLACEAYRRLAEVYLVRGKFEDSQRALAEGLRLSDHLHDEYERVGLLRVQAGLALEAGDPGEADRIFLRAATLALARGFRFEHALTLETQGFVHKSTARPDTADRFIGEAKAIYEELGITRLALRLGRGARALSRPRPKRAPPPIKVRADEWERFGIHTRSHRFIAMLEETRKIAKTRLSVLLIGESGVGKELLVKALHALSDRKGRLVAVNCAAIPETMLESELFGSRRGAFTGAENREGVVVEANRGTLFLDEIGDMPQALQTKLLRFLEDSSFRPVGGKVDQRVDVRVVSATNADLERRVRKGTFREDLYHRIAGDVVTIPPLRGRPEDVEHLAQHFLARALGDAEGTLPALDESVLKAFRAYGWPGNVRELKNAIERAAFRLGSRKVITPSMLPEKILKETGYDLERNRDIQRLTEAIVESNGSISHAARALGITRQTLYRKADQLGLDLDAIRGS